MGHRSPAAGGGCGKNGAARTLEQSERRHGVMPRGGRDAMTGASEPAPPACPARQRGRAGGSRRRPAGRWRRCWRSPSCASSRRWPRPGRSTRPSRPSPPARHRPRRRAAGRRLAGRGRPRSGDHGRGRRRCACATTTRRRASGSARSGGSSPDGPRAFRLAATVASDGIAGHAQRVSGRRGHAGRRRRHRSGPTSTRCTGWPGCAARQAAGALRRPLQVPERRARRSSSRSGCATPRASCG